MLVNTYIQPIPTPAPSPAGIELESDGEDSYDDAALAQHMCDPRTIHWLLSPYEEPSLS